MKVKYLLVLYLKSYIYRKPFVADALVPIYFNFRLFLYLKRDSRSHPSHFVAERWKEYLEVVERLVTLHCF